MDFGFTGVIISFILGLLYISYLKKYDIHKEDRSANMRFAVFAGGIISVIITWIIYSRIRVIFWHGSKIPGSVFSAMFINGPVEETAKLLGILIVYRFIKSNLNEPNDGIIYMACVALGFSLIENFLYAAASSKPHIIIFVRILICTPLHISVSSYIGIAAYRYLKEGRHIIALLFPLFWASLQHGVYNASVYAILDYVIPSIQKPSANIIIIYFALTIIIPLTLIIINNRAMRLLIKYANAVSPSRKTFKELVTKSREWPLEKGFACEYCGNTEDRPTFSYNGIKIQKCICGYFVTDKESLFRIFMKISPEFNNLKKKINRIELEGKMYSSLYHSNYINPKTGGCFFDLDVINDRLENINKSIVQSIEGKIVSLVV